MPLPGKMLASEEVQQNVSSKFEQAMEDLRIKGEMQRMDKARKEADAEKQRLKDELDAPRKERLAYMRDMEDGYNMDSFALQEKDDDEKNAILEEDSELDVLRQARLAQLKKKKEEHEGNLANGHGSYVEVFEDQFLKEVTKSTFTVVHFFSPEFETCKIMDKHMEDLARKHVETRFFKLNCEKSPFFVEKLAIKTLPTVIMFKEGVTIDRHIGFQGFSNGLEFPTRELEERLGLCGVIKMERTFYEEAEKPKPVTVRTSLLTRTEDFDDPFDD